MEQITVRIPADALEDLEREADGHGVSRSEHIRDVLENRREWIREHDELLTEVERLRREKRQILEQREENTELVDYVAEERSLTQLKAEASVVTRAKWFLFGMDGEPASAPERE